MKNVLIIEVPTIHDETVASMQKLFYAFMKAFEDHYSSQLTRFHCAPMLNREQYDDDPLF